MTRANVLEAKAIEARFTREANGLSMQEALLQHVSLLKAGTSAKSLEKLVRSKRSACGKGKSTGKAIILGGAPEGRSTRQKAISAKPR